MDDFLNLRISSGLWVGHVCVCVCVPALTLLCLEWWSEDYDQAAISLLPRIWQWCELASIRFRFKRQQHTGGFQGSVFDPHNYFHKRLFCAKFTPFNSAISCLATRQRFSKRIVPYAPRLLGLQSLEGILSLLFTFSWGSRRCTHTNLFHLLSHPIPDCSGERVNVPRPAGLWRWTDTWLLHFVAD